MRETSRIIYRRLKKEKVARERERERERRERERERYRRRRLFEISNKPE